MTTRFSLALVLFLLPGMLLAQIDSSSLLHGRPNTQATPSSSTEPPLPDTGPRVEVLIQGRDFVKLPRPLRKTDNRVEVVFFFHFGSTWSHRAWPEVAKWMEEPDPFVLIQPSPAVLFEDWGYGARVYFAMEHLRLDRELAPKLSRAIAAGVVDYDRPRTLRNWLETEDVDTKAFEEALNAPIVRAQAASAPQATRAYGVTVVPTIIVDGEYAFMGRADLAPETLVQNARFMVEQLKKGGPRP